MNTYECEMRGKKFRFRGNSAMQAIEKMERKFRWRCHVKLFDAETRGAKWARGWAEWTKAEVPEWFDMTLVA